MCPVETGITLKTRKVNIKLKKSYQIIKYPSKFTASSSQSVFYFDFTIVKVIFTSAFHTYKSS